MAITGREGILALTTATVTRQSFGRYIAQIPGTASRINLDRMNEAVATRPKLRGLIQRFTEAAMIRVFQNVACNAVHSVEARCCRWLLSTRDRVDQDTLPLTHEFLSQMLGVQRSTVSTITRTLQTAGLIRQERGGITVLDRAGLERASCECYERVHHVFERLLPLSYTRD